MIDIIKPLHSNEEKMHIDAIHGHTIIELKDVRTGFRDRIESDNVVTNGAEQMLRRMGYLIGKGVSYNSTFSCWWQILFGGLMLCDEAISTSAIYKPAGVNPVAYGAYKVSNSGDCTELGTYNSAESTYDETRFKQVYDYYTTQANGTIKSACLMSGIGSYYSYGCPTSEKLITESLSNTPIQNGYSTIIRNSGTAIDVDKSSRYSYLIGDKMYEPQMEPITSGASQLKIKEYSYKPNEITLLNWSPTICPTKPIREITFNFTAVSRDYWVIPVQFSHKFVGIPNATSSSPMNANSSYPVLVFDMDNETVTSLTITPTVNITGYCDGSVKEENGDITFYAKTSTYKMYKVNVTDNIFTQTQLPTYMRVSGQYNAYDLNAMYCVSDELFIAYYSGSYGLIYIYDPVNDQYLKVPSLYADTSGTYYGINESSIRYLSDKDIYLYQTSTSGYAMRLMDNPRRLMTINNLPEAVEKTANKTMKVTYELTME